jgi:hypothetical protein
MTGYVSMWPVTLFNICLLRANPQDLPTSTALTALVMALYFMADLITALTLVPTARALQAAAADTLLIGTLTYVALSLRQLKPRARQTLMALAGGGAVLGIVTTALGSLLPEGVSPFYVSLPALLWLLAVYGHILRHALDVPYAMGIVATGAYLFLSLVVVGPFLIAPPGNN